jgi:hypothetical protein
MLHTLHHMVDTIQNSGRNLPRYRMIGSYSQLSPSRSHMMNGNMHLPLSQVVLCMTNTLSSTLRYMLHTLHCMVDTTLSSDTCLLVHHMIDTRYLLPPSM